MDKLLTPHEQNLKACREYEEKKASIPAKIEEVAAQVEAAVGRTFQVILNHPHPGMSGGGTLQQIADFIRGYLVSHYPDRAIPRLTCEINQSRWVHCPQLRPLLTEIITEDELGPMALQRTMRPNLAL
jgi:hypothetical protein